MAKLPESFDLITCAIENIHKDMSCEFCKTKDRIFLWSFYPAFDPHSLHGCDHFMCKRCVIEHCVPRLSPSGILTLDVVTK